MGEDITYTISYKNYKSVAATIVISDKLDTNVSYVLASDSGQYDKTNNLVKWTLTNVPAGKESVVKLTVKVLEGAVTATKVQNGGKTTTVKVGNDNEYTLNVVENPVPRTTNKIEISPYVGKGTLGGVQVAAPKAGQILIRKTTNANGKVVTDKVLLK